MTTTSRVAIFACTTAIKTNAVSRIVAVALLLDLVIDFLVATGGSVAAILGFS